MNTSLVYSFTEPINPESLQHLFQQTDWAKNRTPINIQRILDNTHLTLGVWDNDQLVGFARVVTDDVYRAWIEDVVVDEAYRQQGVGSQVVQKLLKRLEHVQLIMLDCVPALVPFYEKHHFQLKTGQSMQLIQSMSTE